MFSKKNKFLNKKIILVPVILLVLSIFALAEELPPGTLPFGNGGNDGGGEPPPQLPTDTTIIYDSTFEITEINVDVDGEEDKITTNNKKIGEDAKEESDVDFEIKIKNIFNKTIENVEIRVTIEDIDDGDDLDEESDSFDLDAGESDDIDLDFELPLKVDDGDYDVKIHIEGKDEDGNIHTLDWQLVLEVKKDKHRIKITKASLSPSSVSCIRNSNLRLEILNLGREDEDDVKLEVKNEYLGIDIKQENIELGEGADDDAEYEKTFRLEIHPAIEPGTYPLDIRTYYNKDKSAGKKEVRLTIENCIEKKQNKISVKALPPSPLETLGKMQQKTPAPQTNIRYTYNEPFILLLGIVLIIILGVIIFLIGAIIIQLKK